MRHARRRRSRRARPMKNDGVGVVGEDREVRVGRGWWVHAYANAHAQEEKE